MKNDSLNATDAGWSPSHREEVLAALYLIAGLLAWSVDIKWLAWICFAKAVNDTICALIAAFREALRDRRVNAPGRES